MRAQLAVCHSRICLFVCFCGEGGTYFGLPCLVRVAQLSIMIILVRIHFTRWSVKKDKLVISERSRWHAVEYLLVGVKVKMLSQSVDISVLSESSESEEITITSDSPPAAITRTTRRETRGCYYVRQCMLYAHAQVALVY